MPHPIRHVLSILLATIAFLGRTALAQEDDVAKIRVVADRSGVRPGDQVALAVVLTFDEGWHAHTNAPKVPKAWTDEGFTAIPTTLTFTNLVGLTVGAIQWPTPHEVRIDLAATGTPIPYGVFEGTAAIFVPAQVDPAAPAISGTAVITYQACDDSICMPRVTREVPLSLALLAPGVPATANEPELFAPFDRTTFATVGRIDRTFTTTAFGWTISFDAGGVGGLVLLLIVAMLGGFLLNLTPCVLPVIPLKVMALGHSAGNPRRALFLGMVMSLGVIGFWLAIGGAIGTISQFQAVNQLFQMPWFTLGVGAFITIMAVGMLGIFQFNLPGFVYLVDPKTDSAPGSFLFGIMTAVLSTPCTAPFMGGAMAWATKQPLPVTLLTFAAIGLGMALPYIVLALFPRLVAKVPRSGPGSELVKQVMGLFMLAVAAFFVGSGLDPLLREPVDEPIRLHWYVVAGLVALAAGWMSYRLFTRMKTRLAVPLSLAGVLLAVSLIWFSIKQNDRGPIRWVGYTPARFEAAIKEGKVVVLDFTAEWCLNCKALEGTVLHKDAVAAALNGAGVVPMRVDLTGNNPPGQAKLKDLHWVGIPLLAIFGPGLPEPVKYDSYTPDMVLEALAKASPKVTGGQ